jgi:hypothetical protein
MVELDILGMPHPMQHQQYVNLALGRGVKVVLGSTHLSQKKIDAYIDQNAAVSSAPDSPIGTSSDCSDARHLTVDLNGFFEIGAVTLWNSPMSSTNDAGVRLNDGWEYSTPL